MRAQGTIEQVIRKRVADHPQDTWLKWQDEEVSWEQVLSHCQRAANGLLELGVRPGECVAIMMSNRPEFLWVHFGILFIGARSVPVNVSQRGPTLAHILADSDASAIIFEEEFRETVLTISEDLPLLRHLVVADGPTGKDAEWDLDRLLSAPDREPEVTLEETSGTVGIMYTSGTTGPPKGVVATKYDVSPQVKLLEAAGIKAGDTMYTGLPLFHGNALFTSVLGSMFIGAKLALAPRFTASGLFDHCRRYDAVSFNALGGMISILLKQPPRSDDRDHPVRAVLSAGCPPDRWREFEDRFGVRIVEWFGMVDAPGILLNDQGKVGSMGKSGVSGVEHRVVDPDGQQLPPNEVGELIFRHPAGQLTHYHKLPEATEAAYRDGWFRSGDLAEVDEEGFFYYRGRKKESMRRLGENISAWEIETTINAHPAVLESAAHAVPSDLGEDEVKVCLVTRPGHEARPEEILDYCLSRMSRHAIPRYVEFVDELPKTATERNQYATLKKRGLTPETWDREKAGYEIKKNAERIQL